MSRLHQYLVQNVRNVFWFWEINHVIGFTYSAILSAARDEADRLEVFSHQIIWYKGKKKIGERQLNNSVWNIDYLSCVRKILKRDKVVKRCLRVTYTSPNNIVCELLHSIPEVE
jgi:hypothetical protein